MALAWLASLAALAASASWWALTTATRWAPAPTTVWACAAAVMLVRRWAPDIYDVIIVRMTSRWYEEVLSRLPSDARLLDVGIGTGTALVRNVRAVRAKRLAVVGVDYEPSYVERCRANLEAAGLAPRCAVVCRSVFDADLADAVNDASGAPRGSLFDAAYFSGSISLMPEPHVALQIAARLVVPGGLVYVTQTFQRRDVPLLRLVKPALRLLTTIDFGKLTFEADVDDIVRRSGLQLVEKSVVPRSVDNAFQAAFVLVLRAP